MADRNSASTTITMNANKTITAIFIEEAREIYTLTITVDGLGATGPLVGSYKYQEGTVVDISATVDEGWLFVSWNGDVTDPNSASISVIMNYSKAVTANFSQEADITAPAIPVLLAANITKTGVDIFWITDESGDSQVEYWASPGELTPLDTTMVTEHLVRLTDLTPSTTYHYKVMSKDEAGNLTVSDEYTFTTTGTAATFIISSWDTFIEDLDTGTKLTIGFTVTNSGDTAGSYQASFMINGDVEETKNITLNAGASQVVTFTTTKDTAGTYQMSVNEITTSFEVADLESTDEGMNIWFIISIIVNGLLLLTLMIIFIKWYKYRKTPSKI